MVEWKKQLQRDTSSRLITWGHWFAFYNSFFAMIIGNRYIESGGFPDSWIGWGYLFLNTIGHFTFLSFIVYLVFIFTVSLILPYSKILRGYGAIVASLALCILLYDTIIYNDYGIHLSPFAFDLAWTDLNALLQSTSYIVTPIVIIIIELTLANYLWKRIDKIQKRSHGNKVIAFIGVCFIGSHLVHIWADAADVTDITRFDDTYPLSYPATARSFMESHGFETPEAPKINAKTNLKYPKSPLICSMDAQPDVLIIAIDSLRADLVNIDTMPFLTQFGENNQKFYNHLSGGNQYRNGMFSLLYGLQGNYIDAIALDNTSPILTTTFKNQGYRLGLFTSKRNLEEAKPNAIFNDFSQHISNDEQVAVSDLSSIAKFDQWRQQRQQPWFALLNLDAPEDYDTPVGFLGVETVKPNIKLKPAQKVLFNQYRQSLNFIDQQIEQLITSLPNDTLIIITGVSGKVFTSNSNEDKYNISPENVHVPLVIHWPNTIKNHVKYRTNHYALVPTLMTQIASCNNPITDYSSGRHLLQPDIEPWVYIGDPRYFAIYQKNEITIIDRHGKYRIYDKEHKHRLDKKMNSKELINVMREGRRFYNH